MNCGFLLIIALLVSCAIGAPVQHEQLANGRMKTTFRAPYIRAHRNLLSQQQSATVHHATVRETDPPIEQATEFLVMLSPDSYVSPVTLVAGSAKLVSGEWIAPPPNTFEEMYTENRLGFGVRHQYYSDLINGSVQYSAPNTHDIGFWMAFVAVKGEWMMEMEYSSFLTVNIVSGETGHRNVYNLMINRADTPPPTPPSDHMVAKHIHLPMKKSLKETTPETTRDIIILVTDLCAADLTLLLSSVKVGEWFIPPPVSIAGGIMNSRGFMIKHDFYSDNINGTVLYTSPKFQSTPISFQFLNVNGASEIILTFPSYLGIQAINAHVGHRSIYNVLVGRLSWGNTPQC